MTIKEDIAEAMASISRRKNTVFLGQGVINAGRIYGTLEKVPLGQCLEMPVAENLIAGTAIGLAIEGYRPVCIFQRMDFMFIAADAIINHASLMEKMSGGRINLPIIFRTIKADLNEKFWVGWQHSKDLSSVFNQWIPVRHIGNKSMGVNTNAQQVYEEAWNEKKPILIVEDYGSFNNEV
jgi:pyruvate/2-oxoglutarate/acetoin dehydrogenase E1 component